MEAPIDFFGQEIKVGDTILYPGMVADWATMNVGVVEKIVEVPAKYGDKILTKLKVLKERNSGISRGEGKVVTIEAIDRVVVYKTGDTQ